MTMASQVHHDCTQLAVFAGAGGSLVPMYIIEISPVRIRGALGVSYQLALTVGILVSQLFGLRQVLGIVTLF